MMFISILTRKLKKGRSYDDFRKAWYHTVGYGMPVKLYSAINVFNPREVIVVGLGEIKPGQDPERLIRIEVEERLEHPLEKVIEPEIGRTFGVVVSEDDFSPIGEMKLKPATVNGRQTDFKEIDRGLKMANKLFTRAAAERDASRKSRPLKR